LFDVIVLSSRQVLDYDAGLEVLMAKSRSTAQGVDMRDLARTGAEARLAALRAEEAALLAAFPDLRSRSLRRPATAAAATAPSTRQASRGRRRTMSAAQREAVGERMRAYWAARRAEKAATQETGGDGQATRGKGRKRARAK
jgi:hypothetical protein